MTDAGDRTETLGPTVAAAGDEPVVLGGRYELTQRIASGGMAAVWRGYDTVLARTVAVKLLHDHLAADAGFRERFRREAIAAAKLTHPHVVNLYDTGTEGDRVYLVMEFVDGATLRDVIADLGSLAPGQAADIGEKVARALHYAHERGLVHRDVKPANILIGDDGAVKVADFGIAKAEEADGDLTKTGMVLGTAAYVAPEQITGAAPIDGRADQYALGCVLYEALTGRPPFKGDSAVATAAQRLDTAPPPLRAVRPGLPRGLDAVVMRTLRRTPADRFPSARQLADALAPFADSDRAQTAALARTVPGTTATATLPRAAPPRPPLRRAGRALHRERRWVVPVFALALVAGAGVGLALAGGALDPSRLERPQASPAAPAAKPSPVAPPPKPGPLEVTGATAFDPQRDGRENDESPPALSDRDPSTTWRTDIYNSAEFGGLKDGVGFVLDLGDQQRVTGVELATTTPGANYQVSVAERAADEIGGLARGMTVTDADASEQVSFDRAPVGRYVLVWVSAPLPGSGSSYKAEFSEIVVRGTPERG